MPRTEHIVTPSQRQLTSLSACSTNGKKYTNSMRAEKNADLMCTT